MGGWSSLRETLPRNEACISRCRALCAIDLFISTSKRIYLSGADGRFRAGIRSEIIAFLRFKPALLHDADATSDQNAWPTPRSWEMASNVLKGMANKTGTSAAETEAQLLEGTIGSAATAEFLGFLRLFRQLPSIDEILLNPENASLPDEPSAQIAIATALGRTMSDQSVAKGLTYLQAMQRRHSHAYGLTQRLPARLPPHKPLQMMNLGGMSLCA